MRRSAFKLERGRLVEARADAARALALEQRATEPGIFSNRVGLAHLTLARALRAQGRLEEARAAAASAREQLEPSVGADHPDTRAARELELALRSER